MSTGCSTTSPSPPHRSTCSSPRCGRPAPRSRAATRCGRRRAPPPVDGVHRYDWAFDDGIAGALARHGLAGCRSSTTRRCGTQSVAGQDHSPPASVADYAAYAGAFAARYGPGARSGSRHPELTADPVTTFEIWNEPDNGEFWARSPMPRRTPACIWPRGRRSTRWTRRAGDRRRADGAGHLPAGDAGGTPRARRSHRRRRHPSLRRAGRRAGRIGAARGSRCGARDGRGAAVRHRVRAGRPRRPARWTTCRPTAGGQHRARWRPSGTRAGDSPRRCSTRG